MDKGLAFYLVSHLEVTPPRTPMVCSAVSSYAVPVALKDKGKKVSGLREVLNRGLSKSQRCPGGYQGGT